MAFALGLTAANAQSGKPNILVSMADDLGWASVSSYHQGVKSIRTPNIDRPTASWRFF